MDIIYHQKKMKRKEILLHFASLFFCALLLLSLVFTIIGKIKASDTIFFTALVFVVLNAVGTIFIIGWWDKTKKRYEILKSINRKKNPLRRPIDQLFMAYISGTLGAYVRCLPIDRPRLHAEIVNERGFISLEGKRNKESIEIHFEDTFLEIVFSKDEDSTNTLKYSDILQGTDGQSCFPKVLFDVISEILRQHQ